MEVFGNHIAIQPIKKKETAFNEEVNLSYACKGTVISLGDGVDEKYNNLLNKNVYYNGAGQIELMDEFNIISQEALIATMD